MRRVAVLFARRDSVYKQLPGCTVYDVDRDARTFAGLHPVVAHPPCAAWGRLRYRSIASAEEAALAPWALLQVRRWGGVLEHPASSALWWELELPQPGRGYDAHGGFSFAVRQFDFGHLAVKRTWLYVCGLRGELPPVPHRAHGAARGIELITRAEREHTPRAFAEWLLLVARNCYRSKQ